MKKMMGIILSMVMLCGLTASAVAEFDYAQ